MKQIWDAVAAFLTITTCMCALASANSDRREFYRSELIISGHYTSIDTGVLQFKPIGGSITFSDDWSVCEITIGNTSSQKFTCVSEQIVPYLLPELRKTPTGSEFLRGENAGLYFSREENDRWLAWIATYFQLGSQEFEVMSKSVDDDWYIKDKYLVGSDWHTADRYMIGSWRTTFTPIKLEILTKSLREKYDLEIKRDVFQKL